MAFWGTSFTFRGIPCENYNLFISSFGDSSSDILSAGNTSVKIITQDLLRRPRPYLLGVQQTPVLEIPMSFNSPNFLTSIDMRIIESWLFGHFQYYPLQIMQDDLQDVYFNVIFNTPQIQRSGNLIRGINAVAVCDAPWGWSSIKTGSYAFNGTSGSMNFMNLSDDNGFLYPIIECTMGSTGGNLTIINSQDLVTTSGSVTTRPFTFTGLSPYEVLTIDNDRKLITSSIGANRLSNFISSLPVVNSKNWLRFLPGQNTLNITGNLTKLLITYQLARKIA
jgi:phage-related protein